MLYPKHTFVKQLPETGQFNLSFQMLVHFIPFGVNITLSAPSSRSQHRSCYTVLQHTCNKYSQKLYSFFVLQATHIKYLTVTGKEM